MASIGGGDGSSEGRRWDGAEVDVAVVGFVYHIFVLRLTSSNLEKWRLVVGIGFETIRSGRERLLMRKKI